MMSSRLAVGALTTWAFIATSQLGVAQEESGPPPDAEAIAADAWEQPRAETRSRDEAGGPRMQYRYSQAYYSPTLRGHFLAQWMFITHRGQRILFWGARIVHIEHDSPLRQLGLNPGDVITRLDGIPIWRGMYREPGKPWQIVELENHFGRTEVRYILRGSNRVRIGDMMLDGSIPEGHDDLVPIRP